MQPKTITLAGTVVSISKEKRNVPVPRTAAEIAALAEAKITEAPPKFVTQVDDVARVAFTQQTERTDPIFVPQFGLLEVWGDAAADLANGAAVAVTFTIADPA